MYTRMRYVYLVYTYTCIGFDDGANYMVFCGPERHVGGSWGTKVSVAGPTTQIQSVLGVGCSLLANEKTLQYRNPIPDVRPQVRMDVDID